MAYTNDMVISLGYRVRDSADLGAIRTIFVRELRRKNIGKDWKSAFRKLISFCDSGEPEFSIFIKGNSKLPFFCYSELSLVSCPGKGACASYCYSRRAWRYPDAACRQISNMMIMRFFPEKIRDELYRLPKNATLRLYVDGDFSSETVASNWFRYLSVRKDIKAYGYSKSWDELYAMKDVWPENYKLNLSNGGIERKISRETMKTLPNIRGDFFAVKIDEALMKKTMRYSLDYHMQVRSAIKDITGKAGFSCPGLCGQCDIHGSHACGSDKMKGVTIGIGIH